MTAAERNKRYRANLSPEEKQRQSNLRVISNRHWRAANPIKMRAWMATNYIRRNNNNPVGEATKRRNQHLLRRYGLTIEQQQQMIELQDNKCLVCQNPFDVVDWNDGSSWHHVKRPPCIDHDHVTQVVRGILCRPCNILLGACGDNTNVLKRAMEYLERAGRESCHGHCRA